MNVQSHYLRETSFDSKNMSRFGFAGQPSFQFGFTDHSSSRFGFVDRPGFDFLVSDCPGLASLVSPRQVCIDGGEIKRPRQTERSEMSTFSSRQVSTGNDYTKHTHRWPPLYGRQQHQGICTR